LVAGRRADRVRRHAGIQLDFGRSFARTLGTMPAWIAEQEITIELEGKRTKARILVGRPRMIDRHEATCVVALEGIVAPMEIHGEDTLQALLLGVRMLGWRLHDLRSRGARMTGIVEASFGELLCPPTRRSARPRSTGGRGKTRRSRRRR
jgi:hypothetical protein